MAEYDCDALNGAYLRGVVAGWEHAQRGHNRAVVVSHDGMGVETGDMQVRDAFARNAPALMEAIRAAKDAAREAGAYLYVLCALRKEPGTQEHMVMHLTVGGRELIERIVRDRVLGEPPGGAEE